MSITEILERDAVAMWSEVNQDYVCIPCWRKSRVIQWQPVSEEAANLIAKDCGQTKCTRCLEPIR